MIVRVTDRQAATLWVGAGLAAVGLAAGLVAWVGLDRANAYLGVPAAIAALIGLGLSVYALVGAPSEAKPPARRRVRQRASATDRAQVRMVAGSVLSDGVGGVTASAEDVDQRADAAGQARIDQIGGDQRIEEH